MVCRLDQSHLVAGARKSTLYGPKEHAFDQRFRECCTVDGNEFFFAPRTVLMDALGKDFLAAARFSLDQDVDVPFRHTFGQPDGILECL